MIHVAEGYAEHCQMAHMTTARINSSVKRRCGVSWCSHRGGAHCWSTSYIVTYSDLIGKILHVSSHWILDSQLHVDGMIGTKSATHCHMANKYSTNYLYSYSRIATVGLLRSPCYNFSHPNDTDVQERRSI